MRFYTAVFVLAILCASVFSSTLSIFVKDSSGTSLVGTNIELLQSSVVVQQAKAGVLGNYTFEVQDGTYIARFARGGYPVYVSIVQVARNMNFSYTMVPARSYAVYYGTVSAEGENVQNLTLSALQNGLVKTSAKVMEGGAYVLGFLDTGTYEFSLGGKYPKSRINVSVAGQETVLLDMVVLNESAPAQNESGAVNATPFIVVPEQGALYKPIMVKVGNGAQAAANAQIEVLTPDGAVTVGTDEQGAAVINAAKAGRYVFTYQGAQAVVEIAPQEAQQGGQTPPAQPVQQPPVQQGNAQENANAFALMAIGMLVIGAVALGIVAYLLMRNSKEGKGKHEAHAHGAHGKEMQARQQEQGSLHEDAHRGHKKSDKGEKKQ